VLNVIKEIAATQPAVSFTQMTTFAGFLRVWNVDWMTTVQETVANAQKVMLRTSKNAQITLVTLGCVLKASV